MSQTPVGLDALLRAALEHGASDLHVRAGSAPLLRVNGELHALALPALDADAALALVDQAFPSSKERAAFEQRRECDFALSVPGLGRFRANAYRERGSAAMVLRHVREDIPSLAELGLPRVLADLALNRAGLILVTGPTGSGKSTTLAAMVDHINENRRCHILSIEDPIEYLHHDKSAAISQREVSTDTESYGVALRSGMRQDPDVILIGEIRDRDTTRIAIQAAETGHLVLASLHTTTVADTIHRLVDVFDIDEQRQIRASVASSLRGIVCQRLVKQAGGAGRIVACEVAVATPRIADAIADPDRGVPITDIIADGAYYGMQTFEQDLVRLVISGMVELEDAERQVTRVGDLHVALKRAGFVPPRDADVGMADALGGMS